MWRLINVEKALASGLFVKHINFNAYVKEMKK